MLNYPVIKHPFALCTLTLLAAVGALRADTMAYAITESDQYGTIDLTTGAFTQIVANEGQAFAGLGEADGNLYALQYANFTGELYEINPITGALTSIGGSSGLIEYLAFGSTTTGLYALDNNFNLYSINPTTGAPTLIGPTGRSAGGQYTLSTGSGTLYFGQGNNFTLYSISTSTGAATSVGAFGGTDEMAALVYTGGTLYGDNAPPLTNTIDTINTSTGAATTGPSVTGTMYDLAGLAPDPIPASSTPEPATWLFTLTALAAFACRHVARPKAR